jgi:hypothetical protein
MCTLARTDQSASLSFNELEMFVMFMEHGTSSVLNTCDNAQIGRGDLVVSRIWILVWCTCADSRDQDTHVPHCRPHDAVCCMKVSSSKKAEATKSLQGS